MWMPSKKALFLSRLLGRQPSRVFVAAYDEALQRLVHEKACLVGNDVHPGDVRRFYESSPAVMAAAYEEAIQRITEEVEKKVRRDELPPRPPLDRLRHHLQTLAPGLYAQVLEPTLADLRKEHALAVHPVQARWIILQGCSALAAAGVCQLGYSLLGRIAALWQARSPK